VKRLKQKLGRMVKMVRHSNDCTWWNSNPRKCDCAVQQFVYVNKKIEELQEMIKQLKQANGLKPYTFTFNFWEEGRYQFEGRTVIHAYNLEEAEREFKSERWEVTVCPRTLHKLGSEMSYSVAFGEINETLTP